MLLEVVLGYAGRICDGWLDSFCALPWKRKPYKCPADQGQHRGIWSCKAQISIRDCKWQVQDLEAETCWRFDGDLMEICTGWNDDCVDGGCSVGS